MFNMIASILEIVLIVLFALVIVGLIIAARKGYKNGIYKSTYMLLGYAVFIFIALITVKPLFDAIYKFDLSGLGILENPLTVEIAMGEDPSQVFTCTATVGTVESTLTDLVTSFCTSINAAEYVDDLTGLIKTIVSSYVTLSVFIFDFTMIVTLGTFFLEIMWGLVFRKAAPAIAQKVGKLSLVGMIESMVTYIVIVFLTFAPATSLINSINQGIQKSKAKDSQNETVQEIVRLVDIYNDSLFARSFFNWNTELNEGKLTFDSYVIDFFSKTINGGEDTFTQAKEIENLVTCIGNISAVLGANNEDGIPTITSFSSDLVTPVFDLMANSELFTSLFEIAAKLAINSDLLRSTLPNADYLEKIDFEGVSFQEEISTLKGMAADIIDSGIVDDFVDFNTFSLKGSDDFNLIDYLDDLLGSETNKEKVNKIINVFNKIDDFKLLKNSIQALGYWGVTNDSEMTLLKYLGGNTEIENPYDNAENKKIINDFFSDVQIGNEIYMLFDSLWGLASCGEHVIKNTYDAFLLEDNEDNKTKIQAAKDGLVDTLSKHETTEKFRDAICGVAHMKADGSPKERDATKGEHYAIMDSKIIAKMINTTPFLKDILHSFDMSETLGSGYAEAETRWTALMSTVYTENDSDPQPIKFFKEEIDYILNVVTNLMELKLPASPSPLAPKQLSTKLNEEEAVVPEDSKEPFEYVDYDCFLEAAVNLFDGWINADDIFGSMFDLDSRIAPYLGQAFACLKPLDNSKIINAIGIPFITGKLSEFKESTQEFFDIDICIEQIKNSDDFFAQLSDFLDADMVDIVQHFYVGFLMNDEGEFDLGALTDSLSSDTSAFLNKLNNKLTIVKDDPSTPEDETVLDTHPLKYYFSEFLKGFYNFEIFNPHDGVNKNKNMQSLFNYVFSFMNSFGIETPSNDAYATLDAPGKWEEELDGITNLFAILGENNMLNFSSYSSNINSALLYSLSGDLEKAVLTPGYVEDMPKNLGDVLGAVGDSVLFSEMMGGLLDTNLDGTITDASIGVKFENIGSGEYWKQEGSNMSELLGNIAKLDLDLENLDFTKISDVVGLNDMLHSLSNSLIFKNEDGNKFGEWLYAKVSTAMDSMSGGLLEDPDASVWNSSWETELAKASNDKYPTQRIAYYDFVVRDGYLPSDYVNNKAAWSTDDYETKMSAFKSTQNYDSLTKAEIDELYKQPGFMDNYYEDVLQYDEIGRLVNVLANGMKVMDGGSSIDFSSLTVENLDNLLTSINNTNCLRVCSYNAMSLAKNSIGSNDMVDINKANFEYLLLADGGLTDYDAGRTNRQAEIDVIVDFYSNYKELQRIAGDSLDSTAFFKKDKIAEMLGTDLNGDPDPLGTDYLTKLLADLETSRCFHLETVEHRNSDELSFFEDMIATIMDTSGIKELAQVNSETMATRVRKISNHEFSGTTNSEGYNSVWVETDGSGDIIGGEISSITGVLKSVVGITTGDTIDANSISVTDLKAEDVADVLKAINGSYLTTGVINHLIKKAFAGGMGLESLLKYNSTDESMIADFDLTYLDFGGVNNACDQGTEIYVFQKVLEGMQYEDPVTHELHFVSLSNLQEAVTNKSDCFDGVFYFLFNSKTLAKTETRNSIQVKGRSVLLYNALSNFDSYLIGADKDNKILAIEKLYEVSESASSDYAYLREANGIARIIDAAGNSISGITVDNLRNDPTLKEMILNIVNYTYDRNDGNTNFTTDTNVTKGRAYFASEIVSGIFDDVLNTEYSTIASNYTSTRIDEFDDYEVFYFASKSTGGRATTASDINETTFSNLNEVEKNGLDGMISMTEYVNGSADRSGTSISNIASNPFVVGMTTNVAAIRALFSTKLHSNGQDSRMAKVLFVSRGAKTLENETRYADDSNPTNSGLFVMLKYATNYMSSPTTPVSEYIWKDADGYTDDYYGDSFDFSVYGNNLMDYIESCTP